MFGFGPELGEEVDLQYGIALDVTREGLAGSNGTEIGYNTPPQPLPANRVPPVWWQDP